MGAGARVAAYLGALAVVFAGALGAGAAFVPDRVVDDWMARSGSHQHDAPAVDPDEHPHTPDSDGTP